MKLRTFIIIFLVYFQGTAFGKILYFVKNNQELVIPSEREFSDLDAKLQALVNKYYGGQSFIIRVQFIDAEEDDIISSFMTWLGLIKNDEDLPDPTICQDLEIIFEWHNNAWTYKEAAFAQSELIESKFLPKVKEFINEHAFANLTTEREIIREWLVITHNILDQQRKQKILSEGPILVGIQGYQRGHRLAHWMKPDYMYDLEPHSIDSASALKVPYISNAKSKDKDYNEYEFMPTLVKWLTAFKYHNPYSNISEVENKLFEKTRDREDYENKIPNHDLVTTHILNDTSFHEKNRDKETKLYRFRLTEVPISDNGEYNLISDLARFGWRHTACNFLAFDLQKKVFGRYLWPINCAFGSTAISGYLVTDPNFVEIDRQDAFEYAEAGYFVIAVKPGHITTMYPDNVRDGDYGHVVQAGSQVGNNIFLNKVWKSSDFQKVKVYVYLGDILF
jgi:hypothetical protein